MDCPEPKPTVMAATADNRMTVYFDDVPQANLNGDPNQWPIATTYTVPDGTQEVKIEAENDGSDAGILVSFDNGIISDASWNCWTADVGIAPAVVVQPANGGSTWYLISGISTNAQWIWSAFNSTDPRWSESVTCTKNITPRTFRRQLQYTLIDRCDCSDC